MKTKKLRLAAAFLGVLFAVQTGPAALALSAFDAEFYAAQYPDVAAVCGNDESALLMHYIRNGAAEGRLPCAGGIAGDTTLDLTDEQFAKVWSPVPLKQLANYKSLKRKMTDAEFEQAYQEALKIVTPLALMSREDQFMEPFPRFPGRSLSSIKLHHPVKKLQTGTVFPVFYDLLPGISETIRCFDALANQPAQMRVDSLYTFYEITST